MGKNIGIITWHYYHGFGCALQAYALQEVLNSLGYDVQIINYRNFRNRHLCDSKWKEIAKTYIAHVTKHIKLHFFNRYKYSFELFRDEYLNQTRRFDDDLSDLSSFIKFNTVVCGSNQIWAPNVFNPVYMADFVEADTSIISYSASIGLNYIPDELCDVYRKLLLRFHRISVRETKGNELLKTRCGIDSIVTLDPTFLLPLDRYIEIEEEPCASGLNCGYIFCFFLNSDHDYASRVIEFNKNKHLKIVGYSKKIDDSSWMEVHNEFGPREFLWITHNASYVFTDSYHGCIFALLYNKDFFAFKRFLDTDEICQNSRIYQLDYYFGIANRILNERQIPRENYLDYSKINAAIEKLKSDSLKYLIEALM